MEERTSSVIEFIAEASSTFCDTYYKTGCGNCPMNLTHGECLLTELPTMIKQGIHDYLKAYGREDDKDERR